MYFHISPSSGVRGKWRVDVKAEKLIACCDERMTYHRERLAFWEKEGTDAKNKLQAEGITKRDYDVTGGSRQEFVLDQTLVRRLSECESKIKAHRSSCDEFRAYQAMFRFMDKDHEVACDVDDVLFFNIEKADNGVD